MKKNVKILFIVAIVVIIVVIAVKYYTNYMKEIYSAEEVISLLDNNITNNMYLKKESVDEKNSKKSTIEMYLKDNKIYTRELDGNRECLYDYENKKEIQIEHENKKISYFPIDESNNPLTELLNYNINIIKDTNGNLENKGIEKKDGKEYTKILLNTKDTQMYFYIDKTQRLIDRIEYYNKIGNEYEYCGSDIFTYSYNTVTDDNILKFNIDNYTEYEIIGIN